MLRSLCRIAHDRYKPAANNSVRSALCEPKDSPSLINLASHVSLIRALWLSCFMHRLCTSIRSGATAYLPQPREMHVWVILRVLQCESGALGDRVLVSLYRLYDSARN